MTSSSYVLLTLGLSKAPSGENLISLLFLSVQPLTSNFVLELTVKLSRPSFDYFGPVAKRQTNKNDAPTESGKNVAGGQNFDQISDDYYDDYYSYPPADKRSDDDDASDTGFFDQAQIVIAEKLPK